MADLRARAEQSLRHDWNVLREQTQMNVDEPAANDASTRSAPTAIGATDTASRQSQSHSTSADRPAGKHGVCSEASLQRRAYNAS